MAPKRKRSPSPLETSSPSESAPSESAPSERDRASTEPVRARVLKRSRQDDHARCVIYGCGEAFAGQLGGVQTADVPTRIILSQEISKHADNGNDVAAAQGASQSQSHEVSVVVAGGMHSLAVMGDGRVASWGCNDDGALGRRTATDDDERRPTFLSQFALGSGQPVASAVACGASHCVLLDRDGFVWTWGTYSHPTVGRIGFSDTYELSAEPTRMVFGDTDGLVHAIAAGDNHAVALVRPGLVYEWGTPLTDSAFWRSKSSDQDGGEMRPNLREFLRPRAVPITLRTADGRPSLQPVSRVWAGGCQTFASNGTAVWGWGSNNYSQLGVAANAGAWAIDPASCSVLQSALKPNERVTDIAVGANHTLAIVDAGASSPSVSVSVRVLAWGRTHYGRLGTGTTTDECHPVPLPVRFPTDVSSSAVVQKVVAGEAHSLAMFSDGAVCVWGYNPTGLLGLGLKQPTLTTGSDTDDEVWLPRTIQGRQFQEISTAAQHSLFVSRE